MAILAPHSVEFTSLSVEQTERLGSRLGQLLRPQDVVCLVGDLGAGKTSITRGIARGWGSTARVTSPTFTLVNEYPHDENGRTLYHLDCYRLRHSDEAETIGLSDILASDGTLLIEWAERIHDWLPQDHFTLKLTYVSESRRHLQLSAHGTTTKEILEQFKRNAFGKKVS